MRDRLTPQDGFAVRRRYQSPPVAEALARFAWTEPLAWNVTTPGLLFERVRKQYPAAPDARAVMEAEMNPQGAGPASAGFEFRTGPQQMVFKNEAEDRLLIIGPHDMSVHGLPPYEGWESLEQRMFAAIAGVEHLLPDEPTVKQIGLRYINRVELPTINIRFSDYLTLDLSLPPGFPQAISAFMDRIEVIYPDEPVTLAFTWASTAAPEGSSAWILDLDLTAIPPEPLTLADAREMLNNLKVKETVAFEGLLQDSLREAFHEIRN